MRIYMENNSKSIYWTENVGHVKVGNTSGKIVINKNRLIFVSYAVENSIFHTRLTIRLPRWP